MTADTGRRRTVPEEERRTIRFDFCACYLFIHVVVITKLEMIKIMQVTFLFHGIVDRSIDVIWLKNKQKQYVMNCRN